MADVKFTPGDWGWQQGKAGNADQWCLGPGVLLVDGTDGTPGGDSIDRANAHLIAASPDGHAVARTLCALLDRFVTYEDGGFADVDDPHEFVRALLESDIHEAATAYLAKAEGQS